MPDISGIPPWAYLSGGSFVIFFVVKYFAPAIADSLKGQSVQWRSENKYIKQLEEARDKAIAEKEAAENREDSLFKKLTDLEAEMKIMQFKIDQYKDQAAQLTEQNAKLTTQVEKLTSQIAELMGKSDA